MKHLSGDTSPPRYSLLEIKFSYKNSEMYLMEYFKVLL
jgi:hypothetical protein